MVGEGRYNQARPTACTFLAEVGKAMSSKTMHSPASGGSRL